MGFTLPELKWVASPNFSTRTAPIELVVLHDTQGSYESAISWFAQRKSQVSSHIVLREDGLQATQMVPYSQKAWHASAFNSESVGLEMAGYASKGYSSSELGHAARIIAYFLHKYHLPPKYVRPTRVGADKGWTCHQALGALGGGHTDPGFSKVKLLWFSARVKFEYHRGGFRPAWGRSL